MATNKVTIDHEVIRQWAEERGARPAIVKGTNMIRLDLSGFTPDDTLETIAWERWFPLFDQSNLALVHQETVGAAPKSNYNKLVGRETVDLRTGKPKAARRRKKVAVLARASARRRKPRTRTTASKARRGRAPRKQTKTTSARTTARRGSTKRKARPTRTVKKVTARSRSTRKSGVRAH